MVKKKVVDNPAPAVKLPTPPAVNQVPPSGSDVPPGLTGLLWDLSVLMYCSISGKEVDDHKALGRDEQETWLQYAIAAVVGLDKLNKMIVAKVSPEMVAERRRKNIDFFVADTKEFFSRLKRIHPEQFPYEEFAIWFLEGDRKNAKAN